MYFDFYTQTESVSVDNQDWLFSGIDILSLMKSIYMVEKMILKCLKLNIPPLGNMAGIDQQFSLAWLGRQNFMSFQQSYWFAFYMKPGAWDNDAGLATVSQWAMPKIV